MNERYGFGGRLALRDSQNCEWTYLKSLSGWDPLNSLDMLSTCQLCLPQASSNSSLVARLES